MYEPPTTVWPPPPIIGAPIPSPPILPVYTPVSRLSSVLTALLGVNAALCLFGFGGAILSRSKPAHPSELGTVAAVQAMLVLAIGICFLLWTYRLNKNLRAFGVEELRFTPAWAAASFVIPILSLYRPVQVFREIWQASAPDPEARLGQAWQNLKTPLLLGFWWASFLLMNIVDTLSSESRATADIDALDNAVGFVSTLLALQVVRMYAARQETTARTLSFLA